jgi:hypothetical protein
MGVVVAFTGTWVRPVEPTTEDAVWFSGGSLHIRHGSHVRHLDVDVALERRAFWADEAARLGYDPTSEDCRLAVRRWHDFTRALDALDAHNRIVGRPSPYDNATADVARRFALAAQFDGGAA